MGAGGAAQAAAQNGSGCLTFTPRCCTAVGPTKNATVLRVTMTPLSQSL
jgi:hypothetical protein